MISTKKVLKKPSDLGTLWCTGVTPVYEYKNNARTENVVGYRYNLVAIDADAESFGLKILGEKQLEVEEGHVEVALEGDEFALYCRDNKVQITAKATSIEAL